MGLSFQDLLLGAKQGVEVLSDPRKSSIAASGLAGVFSAEVNNLRKEALTNLSGISAKFGPSYNSTVKSLLSPFEKVLGSDSNIPDGPSGTVLGFSYLQAILGGFALLILGIFLLGRGSR